MNEQSDQWPSAGEIWRNAKGAERHVRSVEDDGYSVMFSRPAPANPTWSQILMPTWLQWVESTHAVRTRKAAVVEDKDWGYQTDA